MAEATIPETPETEARINALMAAVACCQMSEQDFATAADAKDQVICFADELAHWIDNGTGFIRFGTNDPTLKAAVQ